MQRALLIESEGSVRKKRMNEVSLPGCRTGIDILDELSEKCCTGRRYPRHRDELFSHAEGDPPDDFQWNGHTEPGTPSGVDERQRKFSARFADAGAPDPFDGAEIESTEQKSKN